MQTSDTNEGGGAAPVLSTFWAEFVAALLVLALGLTVLIGSWHLGSKWTSDGPGPGYFPFYIALIMCISGAGIAINAVRKRNPEPFVDSQQLKQVLTVLIPAAVYVGAVLVFGLYVASAVYIALFMWRLGKYSPIKSSIAAVVIMALFFFMFEVLFKVALYKGAINLLQFTGY
jgi:hypothetical protein